MKHASHLPNILEQCHSIDIVDKSVTESLEELQPKETEVQVFGIADNSKPQELFGIILCSDVPENVEREAPQQSHNSIVELKELPAHLKYSFLEKEKIHPVIISSALDDEQEQSLLSVLRLYKNVIGYSIDDIKGLMRRFVLTEYTWKMIVHPPEKVRED